MTQGRTAPESRRMTRQRAAVLDDLADNRDFRTAQEIFDHLRSGGHSIGLATVYRNLQALVDAESVDTVRTPEGESLFRLCETTSHHHHLVCRRCGHTEEITEAELTGVEDWVSAVAQSHGFTAPSHSIELAGICAACGDRTPDDPEPSRD